jgi:hypothetical protein
MSARLFTSALALTLLITTPLTAGAQDAPTSAPAPVPTAEPTAAPTPSSPAPLPETTAPAPEAAPAPEYVPLTEAELEAQMTEEFRRAFSNALNERLGGGSGASQGPARAPRQAPPSRLRVTRAGGSIGATEQGIAVGGQVEARTTVSSGGESVGTIDVSFGQPILRLRGRAEAIPLRLLTPISEDRRNGYTRLDFSFAPATGDFQVSIPTSGSPANSHLVITPQAALRLGIAEGPFEGSVRLRAAPAVGVAHDNDGTAFVFGARVGGDLTAAYEVDARNRLEASFGLGGTTSFLTNLAHSVDVSGSARWVHTIHGANGTPTGQLLYVGLEGQTQRLDVLPSGTATNTDDGRTGNFGVVVGAAF